MLIVKENEKKALKLAVKFLKAGKAISFATDTVYGIACDASNSKAVAALYKIKNRQEKNPIAIFVKDLVTAKKIFSFDETAEKIAEKYLTKGLTFVLKTRPQAALKLSAKLNKNKDGFLGFRIVNRSFIKKIFKKFNGPLAVTSANTSGQKAAINAKEVEKYFSKNKALALLVDGGISKQKMASTVVKISDGKIMILRQGLTEIKKYENF
jgi:L-threonylcarbamoyladenylate synthase